MINVEILFCKKCRKEYDAHAEDLGTYFCPTCTKPKLPDYDNLAKFVEGLFAKAMKERQQRRDKGEN